MDAQTKGKQKKTGNQSKKIFPRESIEIKQTVEDGGAAGSTAEQR